MPLHRLSLLCAAVLYLVPHAVAGGFVFDPVAPSGLQTPVANGGFESGLGTWAPVGSQGGFSASATAFDGSLSAKGVPTASFTAAGFALRSEPIAVTPGSKYVLSGFFDTSAMTDGNLYLDLDDVAFEPEVGNFEQSVLGSSVFRSWFFAWQEFTVPAGVTSVRLRVVYDGGNDLPLGLPGSVIAGQPGFVDGVALTPAAQFVPVSGWIGLGKGLVGTHSVPLLTGSGSLAAATPMQLVLTGALQDSVALLVVGLAAVNVPLKGGVLVPQPSILIAGLPLDAVGSLVLATSWPVGVPSDTSLYFQSWMHDPAGPQGFSASTALLKTTP